MTTEGTVGILGIVPYTDDAEERRVLYEEYEKEYRDGQKKYQRRKRAEKATTRLLAKPRDPRDRAQSDIDSARIMAQSHDIEWKDVVREQKARGGLYFAAAKRILDKRFQERNASRNKNSNISMLDDDSPILFEIDEDELLPGEEAFEDTEIVYADDLTSLFSSHPMGVKPKETTFVKNGIEYIERRYPRVRVPAGILPPGARKEGPPSYIPIPGNEKQVWRGKENYDMGDFDPKDVSPGDLYDGWNPPPSEAPVRNSKQIQTHHGRKELPKSSRKKTSKNTSSSSSSSSSPSSSDSELLQSETHPRPPKNYDQIPIAEDETQEDQTILSKLNIMENAKDSKSLKLLVPEIVEYLKLARQLNSQHYMTFYDVLRHLEVRMARLWSACTKKGDIRPEATKLGINKTNSAWLEGATNRAKKMKMLRAIPKNENLKERTEVIVDANGNKTTKVMMIEDYKQFTSIEWYKATLAKYEETVKFFFDAYTPK